MADNNENKVLNVPHLRFPEFSGEWNKYTINDLATVVGGGTPDTTVKSYWGGDIQWFTPSEIGKNKYVDFSKRTITRDGLDNSSAKLLPLHTILLSSRATVGECSIASNECTRKPDDDLSGYPLHNGWYLGRLRTDDQHQGSVRYW